VVHKHNLLAVFYVDRESSAYPTLYAVLCAVAAAIFSMQMLTSILLIIADVNEYLIVAKIIAPASFCILVLSILWFKLIVKRGKYEVSKESETLFKVDPSQYYHPVENRLE
jgi:heme A synthase